MSASYDFIRTVFRRHEAEFARHPDLASFSAATGTLRDYVGGWCDNLYLTDKAFGIGTLAKHLAMPPARTMADLFEAARLKPATRGNVTLPDWCYAGSSRGDAFPSAHVGGKRGIRDFGDGSVVRTRSGAVWTHTEVKPRREVREAWAAIYGRGHAWPGGRSSEAYAPNVSASEAFDLCSFEAVTRDDGVLIIAKGGRGFGDMWIAMLRPGETIRGLLPAHDVATLDQQAADDAAAWGHLVTGADGVLRLPESGA